LCKFDGEADGLKKAYVRVTLDYDALDVAMNHMRVVVLRRGVKENVVGTIMVIGQRPKDVKGESTIRVHSFVYFILNCFVKKVDRMFRDGKETQMLIQNP